jgi:hypothetical protein
LTAVPADSIVLGLLYYLLWRTFYEHGIHHVGGPKVRLHLRLKALKVTHWRQLNLAAAAAAAAAAVAEEDMAAAAAALVGSWCSQSHLRLRPCGSNTCDSSIWQQPQQSSWSLWSPAPQGLLA